MGTAKKDNNDDKNNNKKKITLSYSRALHKERKKIKDDKIASTESTENPPERR